MDPDPVWSITLGTGGSDTDYAYDMAVDEDGYVYVVGSSSAAWGCSPTPCTVRPHAEGYDAFIAKLDPTGSLVWNTFLGGTADFESATGLVLDEAGNIYVGGGSNAGWGCTPAPCTVRDFSGGHDGFVAKLDASGNLIWNTFLGGGSSSIYAIIRTARNITCRTWTLLGIVITTAQ
jgi:outer membrane protein assembly factor BamB